MTSSALLVHRRRMVLQGQIFLERLALRSAGKPFEPLPKRKKRKPSY